MLSIHGAPSVRSLRKSFASHLPHLSSSQPQGGHGGSATPGAARSHSSYSHKSASSFVRSTSGVNRIAKENQYQVEIIHASASSSVEDPQQHVHRARTERTGAGAIEDRLHYREDAEEMLWLSRPGEAPEESLPSHFNHRSIIDSVCDNFCFSLLPVSDPRASSNVATEFRNKSGVPVISLRPYLERLVRYANAFTKENEEDPTRLSCGIRSLLIAAELVERCAPNGIGEDAIHRLFASAFLVAIKSHEDARFSNQYWAKVAGVDTFEEMNAMEIKFLECCKWSVTVSNEEFRALANKFT